MRSRLRHLAVALGFTALIPACDHPSVSSPTAPALPPQQSPPPNFVSEVWSGTAEDPLDGVITNSMTLHIRDNVLSGDLARIRAGEILESGSVDGTIEASIYAFHFKATLGESTCVVEADYAGTIADALLVGTYKVTRLKMCGGRGWLATPFEGTFRFTRQN